eukprot:m51a1_g9615 putative ctd phosphatase-like protein (477) ;mRNA; r:1083327-1085092
MSTKVRSSQVTKPEETTPSAFSFRRFWPSKQNGSVPTSKRARCATEALPTTTASSTPVQGTPTASPTLIASVSAATVKALARADTPPPSSSSRRQTSESTDAAALRPAALPQDSDASPSSSSSSQPSQGQSTTPRGSKIFGLFSPVFSLFMRQQKDPQQQHRKEAAQQAQQQQHQAQQALALAQQQQAVAAAAVSAEEAAAAAVESQTQQEATQSPAEATLSPTAAQPPRRNSNVVAMEGEDLEEDDESSMGDDAEPAADWDDESNPYCFIRRLPYLPRVNPAMERAIGAKLPGAPRATLVLDLDETLVHCSTEPVAGADVVFPVVWNGIEYRVYAKKRPGLEEFMEAVSPLFEVVVFTASQQVYADKLLDIIDPQGRWFRHRVFRDACVCVEGNYIKDLAILGRDLARTVIVDNSPQAFGFQYNNGIPILSWFDAPDDAELANLMPLLRRLATANDVRPVLRNHFKLYKRIERRF